MCRDCGCQQANHEAHNQGEHEHWVDGKLIRHTHAPAHTSPMRLLDLPRRITVEQSVLAKNNRIAAGNRKWFETHGVTALNLISSPGSGKTTLLEKTVGKLGPGFRMSVLTGDQERDFDAQRLRAAGARVLQLNTPGSCHLDAAMIEKELGRFVEPEAGLLVIENVGNLVCPAAFDLGESRKIALLSTTEGEDKPSKYPLLFREAALIVLTKMDLRPHLDWDLSLCESHIRKVNPTAPILRMSAKTGEGMDGWIRYLETGRV